MGPVGGLSVIVYEGFRSGASWRSATQAEMKRILAESRGHSPKGEWPFESGEYEEASGPTTPVAVATQQLAQAPVVSAGICQEVGVGIIHLSSLTQYVLVSLNR